MPDDPKTKYGTKEADSIAEQAVANIKKKIESGEWGQKEINENMLKLRDEYIRIIGHPPKGVDFSIYEDKEKDKKD
tara:strand:- start:2685 stop:2912 length:228 start_codon:yes stop_codon:yes gene_type:complete